VMALVFRWTPKTLYELTFDEVIKWGGLADAYLEQVKKRMKGI
jgi:hypothetical protein